MDRLMKSKDEGLTSVGSLGTGPTLCRSLQCSARSSPWLSHGNIGNSIATFATLLLRGQPSTDFPRPRSSTAGANVP